MYVAFAKIQMAVNLVVNNKYEYMFLIEEKTGKHPDRMAEEAIKLAFEGVQLAEDALRPSPEAPPRDSSDLAAMYNILSGVRS